MRFCLLMHLILPLLAVTNLWLGYVVRAERNIATATLTAEITALTADLATLTAERDALSDQLATLTGDLAAAHTALAGAFPADPSIPNVYWPDTDGICLALAHLTLGLTSLGVTVSPAEYDIPVCR